MPNIAEFSVITCPHCGHRERELMSGESCQFFYDCRGCGELLRANAGDCCVFCSFGSVKCPPRQLRDDCPRIAADITRFDVTGKSEAD